VLCPDERDLPDIDHITVFRRGSHFIMLYAAMDGDGPGRWHARLASSSDGVHWERFHTREDFLSGGGEGAWDETIIPCGAPAPSGDKLLPLLFRLQHGAIRGELQPARRARRRRSGHHDEGPLRGAARGEWTGYLLTRELLIEGNTLRLNVALDDVPFRDADVRVEVCRHPPLGEHADYYYRERGYSYRYEGFGLDDCDPVRGNSTCAPVMWNGNDLSALRGQPAYLRFELRHADLFSFSVTNE